MKTKALALCAVLVLMSAVPVGGKDKDKDNDKDAADKPATSKEVGYGTFGATQGRYSAVVSAYMASFERSEKHFALQVAVGAAGKGPEITFKQESFWLVDAQGVSHEMSAPQELANDPSLIEFTDDMQGRFPLQLPKNFYFMSRTTSDFYSLDGMRWKEVHIDQDTYFEDVLFFVHPAGGLDGLFTLQIAGEGMEDALEVKFTVPPDKKKYKKENKKSQKDQKNQKDQDDQGDDKEDEQSG